MLENVFAGQQWRYGGKHSKACAVEAAQKFGGLIAIAVATLVRSATFCNVFLASTTTHEYLKDQLISIM